MLSFACRLLNYPIQKPEKAGSGDSASVRGGSKRVDNTRMRTLLNRMGMDMKYSDYRRYVVWYGLLDFISLEAACNPSSSEISTLSR